MTEKAAVPVTRRVAIAAGLAGAAIGASALPAAPGAALPEPSSEQKRSEGSAERLPVVFLPHGGGPWPFVDLRIGSKVEQAELATYLRSVANVPKSPPQGRVGDLGALGRGAADRDDWRETSAAFRLLRVSP
ncbi:MAG: hypothetical protein WDO74_37280 [Pseudomonadota bacterium]